MSDFDAGFGASELARRLDQIVAIGQVSAVDLGTSRARVRLDEGDDAGAVETDFMPWLEMRHGYVRTRFVPALGERVFVLAPSGELGAGIILGGMACDESVPPWTSDKAGFDFGNGVSWSHDPGSGVSSITLPASGRIELKIGGSTKIILSDGVIEIEAASVKLGPPGNLKEVARKGDQVQVGANVGTITGGSSAVKAS